MCAPRRAARRPELARLKLSDLRGGGAHLFDAANKLGDGASGVVFRAALDSTKQTVAVKQFRSG